MRTSTLSTRLSAALAALAVAGATMLPAQKPAPAAKTPPKALVTAQNSGVPMVTISDVSSTVGVEAVLLPYSIAKRTFGREVAEKYAVVSLTVSNRDQKQGLILHSIFLDYSHWLFSGTFSGMAASTQAHTETWQQQDKASQVASAEVRTVRTDFQDAQVWSKRNMVIHIATAVGATAASLAFSTSSDLFAPSVAAFNGNVVPALSSIWPDNSQTQLNLLNDIGFRNDRVIPAKSSDIVIAFFPLERFLTPTMQKIYKDAPAIFFNPSELILEGHSKDKNMQILRQVIEDARIVAPKPNCDIQCALVKDVVDYEAAYEQLKLTTPPNSPVPNPCGANRIEPGPEACNVVGLLNRVSLNNIRLVIGGIMTVDASSIPAMISSVQIGNGNQAGTWASGQNLTGTLSGSYLSGGAITLIGVDASGNKLDPAAFGPVTIDPTTASDSSLPFSVAVGSAAIPIGSRLLFTVTKLAQDKSSTVSTPIVYTVGTDPTLAVTSTSWAASQTITGTLSGTGLSGVRIVAVSGTDPGGSVLPAGNFTPSITTPSDTAPAFSVAIGATAVPLGSTLNFQLSTAHPDGTPVVITYNVPTS